MCQPTVIYFQRHEKLERTSSTVTAARIAWSNCLTRLLACASENCDMSRRLWTNKPPESTRMPSRLHRRISAKKHHSGSLSSHLRGSTTSPSAQFFSGSKLESMDTSTIGISVNSSPNISLNGTKTPWSRPGPLKPRPSCPRISSFGVVRARYPA